MKSRDGYERGSADLVALRKSRDRLGYLYRKATRRLAQLQRARGAEARQKHAEQAPNEGDPPRENYSYRNR